MSFASQDKQIARRKALVAGAATAGSVVLMTAMPVLGVIMLIPSAYLIKDWFSYRAKRGMRF